MSNTEGASPFSLTDRDVEILRGLLDARVMTLAHVAALYFEGASEAAKKRVQKLKAAHLVGQRPRNPTEPSILFLAKRGYELLRDTESLDGFPVLSATALAKRPQVSPLTLRHELQVMDVKAALSAAIRKAEGLRVSKFSTYPAQFQFRVIHPAHGEVVTVRPDAMLVVEQSTKDGEPFEHVFFVEVDRSNEVLDIVAEKAVCYRQYYAGGGFAQRHGAPAQAFADYPFRVLMVCKSVERRDNIADRLLELSPPILSQTWLTTHAELIASPLDPIWIEPRDRRRSPTVLPAPLLKRKMFDDE